MPRSGGNAAERRNHHRELERQLVRLLRLAVLVDLGHVHLAGFDLVDLGVDDPFDVAVAHLRFEHALGVADAAEAEMADIGFGRDEGHRHLVADAPLRRSASMIMANSYAGPKQEAP